MKNVVIILVLVLAGWFVISRMNTQPQKPDNTVTQYADNLATSEEKAEEAAATVNLTIARAALSRFKNSEGRIPNSMEEMVELNYLDRAPKYVKYDPKSGSMEIDLNR